MLGQPRAPLFFFPPLSSLALSPKASHMADFEHSFSITSCIVIRN